MATFLTWFLLLLMALPFAALASDALGRTRHPMLRVVAGVAAASLALTLDASGLRQRENAANLVAIAFFAWPLSILMAKGFNPGLSWLSLLLSVPAMSWYLVNLLIQFYYPLSSPGVGAGMALFVGWIYMTIPFVPLCGLFLAGRAVVRRVGKKRSGVARRRKITLSV